MSGRAHRLGALNSPAPMDMDVLTKWKEAEKEKELLRTRFAKLQEQCQNSMKENTQLKKDLEDARTGQEGASALQTSLTQQESHVGKLEVSPWLNVNCILKYMMSYVKP